VSGGGDVLARLRAALDAVEPVYIALRELGDVIDPAELERLLAHGLTVYNLAGDGEAPVRGIEAREFVELGRRVLAGGIVLELLAAAGTDAPAAV